MKKKSLSGMTLMEILICSLLLLLLLGGIYSFFYHEKKFTQSVGVDITLNERLRIALDTIAIELKQGVPVPSPPGSSAPIPSAVIWPDSYNQETNNLGVTPYERGRLIFSILAVDPEEVSFDRLAPSSYRWVEYRTEVDEDGFPRLVRRVYPVSSSGSGGGIYGLTYNNGWKADLPAFQAESALEETVLLAFKDPHPSSELVLFVLHPRTGGTDLTYGTRYNRQLFQIRLYISQEVPGKSLPKVIQLTSQVAIQSR